MSIHSPILRPLLVLLGLLSGLLTAGVTEAQGSEPLGDPHFYIEEIEVEGLKRASPEVVISESLLTPGREYSESDLRNAIYRINRLPFVLESRFSLAKGSERGRFRLIIEVDEVARFFFGADVGATAFNRDLSLDELEPEDFNTRTDGLAGLRFFFGKYGTFFGAVTSNGSIQLGLTRYQLWGRRGFLSLGLVRQGCCPVTVRPLGLDPTFSRWSSDENSLQGTITAGLPLAGNHSLRFEATRFQTTGSGPIQGSRIQVRDAFADSSVFNFHDDLVDQAIELAWIYDSSDDPTFPTRGRTFSLAYELRELRADLFTEFEVVFDGEDLLIVPTSQTTGMRTKLHRLIGSWTQHWPVSRRHTFSATLRMATGISEIEDLTLGEELVLRQTDLDVFEAGLTLRHSAMLWETAGNLPPMEIHWETLGELGYEKTSPSFGLADNPLERWSLQTALVFRSPWGLARLTLSVVDVGEAG